VEVVSEADTGDKSGQELIDAETSDTNEDPDTGPGMLAWSKVPNLEFKGDFLDVSWRPDGSTALIITSSGDLLKYDSNSQTLSLASTLGGTPSRVAWCPTGAFAYVAGWDGADGRLWRFDPETGGAASEPFLSSPGVRLNSVQFSPDGAKAVVTGYSENPPISRAWLLDSPFAAVSMQQAWPGWPVVVDATFGAKAPLLYDGAEFVLTSEGWNGAASHSWVLAVDEIWDNGWKPSFGNPGRATWRPNSSLGVLVGTSSHVVYAFGDGAWKPVYTPTQQTGSNLSGIGWNPNGTRALITGRAFGSPLKGTVVEWRFSQGQDPAAASFIDQSIPAFDAAPWLANSSTYVFQAAFRPNSICQEGLAVASDSGSPWSPGPGLAARFWDISDSDCPQN
jgi:hypothetical protein